jgi:putative membrane protein
MGGADIIPGVSGGTMALIVGIYERLIASLSRLFASLTSLIRQDVPGARSTFQKVEWSFLLPLGVGIVTAIAIGARIIRPLLEHYPAQSNALFFGLVAASLAVPWLRIQRFGLREGLTAVFAAVIAFLFTGFPESAVADPPLLRVFGSAAVSICAMILPGVSGAYLLKVLGLYEATLEAITHFDVFYIATFGAGAAIGLGMFSRLLNWLLNTHHDLTMAALIGLMAGALRALWPWLSPERELRLPESGDPFTSVLLLFVLGFVLVAALTWWGSRRIAPRTKLALKNQSTYDRSGRAGGTHEVDVGGEVGAVEDEDAPSDR